MLDTHWFVDGAWYYYPSYQNTNKQVNSGVAGSYYNYDFGLNNLRTDSDTEAFMVGQTTNVVLYDWSHQASGEWSVFLHGDVILE